MNKNLVLVNYLKSVKDGFRFNLNLLEEIDNLTEQYTASVLFLEKHFLNKDQKASNFSTKEVFLTCIRNNILESYQKPVADALIKEYISSIEKNIDVVLAFEQKFSQVKEKLNQEFKELNKNLGFNLINLLEEDIFAVGSIGINRNYILENFNKNNSSLALINDIIFVLGENI